MVMGGHPDRRLDSSAQRRFRDPACALPPTLAWLSQQAPIASERELATGVSFGALVNDATNRRRKRRVAHSIQNNLGDRSLSSEALAGRLVIDSGGKTIERGAIGRLNGGTSSQVKGMRPFQAVAYNRNRIVRR